jgi:hypothetical protein
MRSSAWAAGELWFRVPALEAAVGILLGSSLGLGGLAGPPDQSQRAEHGDLEDDEEKEDWPETAHVGSV